MVNNAMYSEDDESQEDQYVNYKQKYRELKKNLRYLIYENECFQDELRKAQHNFVSISRDKSFLLDRILKYEKPQGHSSDSEATESSDEDEETKMPSAATQFLNQRKKIAKRKRSEAEMHNGNSNVAPAELMHGHVNTKQAPSKPIASKPIQSKNNVLMKKPKKPQARKSSVKKERDNIKGSIDRNLINSHVMKSYDLDNMQIANEEQVNATENDLQNSVTEYKNVEFEFSTMSGSEGHMTREEVERHLESRRFSPELNTTATVPAELFSHEPEPESDFEDGEICEFIQLEEDGTSADMILE